MDDPRLDHLDTLLQELVASARQAFGEHLASVALFGSAAEGKLRPASDVNLLFLLTALDADRLDAFREPLRAAETVLNARAMLLLEEELPVAAELFAVKFFDLQQRHRVLFGLDPLESLVIQPLELRRRLREVLLNLALRLRERYVSLSLREEQLIPLIADAAGPLRVAAAALLELQGRPAASPREALETVAQGFDDPAFRDAVAALPTVRQTGQLAPGVAGPTLFALARLASALRQALEHSAIDEA